MFRMLATTGLLLACLNAVSCAKYDALGANLWPLLFRSTAAASAVSVSGPVVVGGTVINPLVFSGAPEILTVAGSPPPAAGSGNLDGTGTSARFNLPDGIATDGVNLYISDDGNTQVRKMVISSGVVTTQVTGVTGLSGMTTDGSNLYYTANHQVWSLNLSTNAQTMIAGGFGSLQGITTDGSNVYFADQSNNLLIKVNIASGSTLWAVAVNSPYGVTTNGSAVFAVSTGSPHSLFSFDLSTGASTLVASIPTGTCANVYGLVTDGTSLYGTCLTSIFQYNSLSSGGTLSTNAGSSAGYVDGPALTTAKTTQADFIVSDGTALYFTDYNQHAVRRYY